MRKKGRVSNNSLSKHEFRYLESTQSDQDIHCRHSVSCFDKTYFMGIHVRHFGRDRAWSTIVFLVISSKVVKLFFKRLAARSCSNREDAPDRPTKTKGTEISECNFYQHYIRQCANRSNNQRISCSQKTYQCRFSLLTRALIY